MEGILADSGFLPASYPGELHQGGQALKAHRSKGGPDKYRGSVPFNRNFWNL